MVACLPFYTQRQCLLEKSGKRQPTPRYCNSYHLGFLWSQHICPCGNTLGLLHTHRKCQPGAWFLLCMSTSEEPLITPEPPRRRLSGICCVTHYEADASLPAISLGVPWSWRPCLSQLHSGILFTRDSVPGAGTLASAAPRCPPPVPSIGA